MNPIGKNLHLDISTSRPVLNVFPTSHPAVRLPLNLEEIIIIIMFNHVCINNVKWKDTFSSYMRMSPPWGLCFIFLVEPTFAKYIFLNYCLYLLKPNRKAGDNRWFSLNFTFDSAFQSSFRFSILTSPPPARWVACLSRNYHSCNCVAFHVSILNMIGVNVKVHLLKGSDFWLCSPIQLPLLDLRTIKDQR